MENIRTITPQEGTDTAWRPYHGFWILEGHTDGDIQFVLSTTRVDAVDRDRQLAETRNGSIYYVPGPWPSDLDLPPMREPVRPWAEPKRWDDIMPALAGYLTAEAGGTWDRNAWCTDLLPQVTLRAYPDRLEAHVRATRTLLTTTHPSVKSPMDIARFLRRPAEVLAWLLAEVGRVQAVMEKP